MDLTLGLCWSVQLLGSLVALGVPAAKYNMCNLYGDFLGDWTQYHLQALIEALEDDDSNPHKLTAAKRSRLRRLRDQLHNGGISLPPTPEPAARVLDTDGGEPGV
ncbi:uncharacterized protein MONBRDRAFT_26735 [Monosiga brevicollis MX1]|uniref:Uncharacterized protein n=1 Tax=Monosiga brevicollis TaxID=81824 RepID=A9V378_MONBE|nr:uncharacterized protein MONBRDRAFT_26735 [Monosiga brevicollis MX1]EDQ88141.1 predicted protein [Monosiga brevicollis MX1]|eukprot:XP_001747217.1 hypothetical protein [Monosiga brevicollis MX1]